MRRAAREGPESVQAAQFGKMLVPCLGPHRVVGEFVPIQVERVPNLLRRALVAQAPGERLDQPVHALGRLEQDRPAVGACLLLVELGEQWLVEQIREQNSLWFSVGRHAGASVVAKMPVNTAFLPYGGSCVSTWIGPLVHDPG